VRRPSPPERPAYHSWLMLTPGRWVGRFGTEYTDTKSLRYGRLMIMTDQDHDGSHIKGLLINLLHHFWPSLLKLRGFLQVRISWAACARKSGTF
jgi:hypothetical protein